jgi:capsular polysaccharide biosynthesis protein
MGASIREIDAACTTLNPLPKTVHASVRQQFLIDQTYTYPNTFLAILPQGRAWGDGFIITPDDQLLGDVSIDFRSFRTKQSSVELFWRLYPLTEIDGTVAVLATDGGNLYYHWLFNLLPRLDLMRRADVDFARIDYFLVNSLKNRFQRECLALLGIDQSRVIESTHVRYLRARELVVPSVPLGGPSVCSFLRKAFLSTEAKSSGRRLYIARGQAGYRRVLNEGDVIQCLARRGFEMIAMESLSMSQQAAALAACDVVVAPHGGGLSNLVFCSPGTKVVEIFSPELVAGYFWKISNQIGLDYYYLLGKGPPESHDPDYPQSWDASADIEVDLAVLDETLDLANIH